jgi:group I intron endonuclease
MIGIYVLINKLNQKFYVGSSQNIGKRKNKHYNELRKGTHKNIHLQNAWNTYGEQNFEFNVIENVDDKNMLIEREQYYIDQYDSSNPMYGYNICPKAYSSLGYKHNGETIKRMCIQRKKNSQKYARYGNNHWRWGKILPKDAKCFYRENHPDYNGEKSPRAKLTNEKVLKIRELYKTGKYSQNILGKMFMVHKRTIGKIVNRERWTKI